MTRVENAPEGAAPLGDVRVLDVSGPIGAYASRLLAILGADVLLVEPPAGDALRHAWPRGPRGEGLGFAYYHGGQRSTVLDVGDAAVVPALARLAAGADVVLASPVAGALAGYDESPPSLTWVGDEAIVCAITPFGLTGPTRRWRATPLVSHAISGGMGRMGAPEGPPLAAPGRLVWNHAGTHAAIAVLAALFAREELGGQWIDFSVHESLAGLDFALEWYDREGKPAGGRKAGMGFPPTGTWDCADGAMDVTTHRDSHWQAFREMLGNPEELSAPALADPLVRRDVFDGLIAAIRPLLERERRVDLVTRGLRAGLPCAPWNSPLEFVAEPQVAARAYIVDVEDPETGAMRMPGSPMVTTPPLFVADRPAPRLGGDGDGAWTAERAPTGGTRGPLRGLRVLTFGTFIAGNMTGLALAELGADVVKIEARDRPEVLRGPSYAWGATATEPSGVTNTVMYAGFTRGARGLSLDMHAEAGRDLFRELVEIADVVVENFGTAEQMAKWGCRFEDLRALNPELVMLSLSGYGRTGPMSVHRAYGSNLAAYSGLSVVWGVTHGMLTDYICAAHGVVGILAGVLHARRRGEAVAIDAAQIETTTAVMGEILLEPLVNGRDVGAWGNEEPDSLLSGAFRCAGDDRWVAVDVVGLDDWKAVCAVVDRSDLSVDERAGAIALREKLRSVLAEWTAPRSPHTCAHLLQAVGVAAGAVQDMEDVARDPSLHARGYVVEIDQPDLGRVEYPASPYRMSRTPAAVLRPGPRLGQHTVEVLAEWLGLDRRAVNALAEQGAVFIAPG